MRRFAFLLIAVFAGASGLEAQSLFAARGLGVPIAPVDARARALGGIGVGLLGLNASLMNPAEVAGVSRRGVSAALQPGTAAPELEGQTGDLNASRFPLVRFIYPFSDRVVATLGYGSFLEQSWGVRLEGSEQIGSATINTTDVVQSNGGIARLALGAAWQMTPSLAIGVGAGLLTGNLDRRVTRSFSDTLLVPFETRLRWKYDGAFFSGGLVLDVAQVARASASVTIMQDIDITGQDERSRDDRADMPLRLAAGASGLLSSMLLATVGAEWSTGAEGAVFTAPDATARQRDTWRVGGGFEYAGIRTGSRTYPLRLGASWSQLPYYNEGERPANEWAASLGIGFLLAGDEAGPLAQADIAIERGERKGLASTRLPDGVVEPFWRFTFSLSLFGN